jgi:transcriptional regulator with XRE-family HTH domain
MRTRSSQRQRPTELSREVSRRSTTIAESLGRSLRIGRRRLRLTQRGLAARVGVDQSRISQIELGKGSGAPLELWVALGVAVGQPLAVAFSRTLGETRQPVDAGHLEMQEHLLGLGRATGRRATFELPTRPSDPMRSVDVCVRDARHRVLIIEEAWNTFGDTGAAIRATHRKQAEAADLAATIDDGGPYRVATVWIVRENAANRAIVHTYPEIMRSAFPGSSRSWASTLTAGHAPPGEPGLVWFDAALGRIREWRRPASSGSP